MKLHPKITLRNGVSCLGGVLLLCGIVMMSTSAYLYSRFGDAVTFTPPASCQIAPQEKDFKVAFFGDFAMQRDIFTPVLKKISAEKPAFAISVGDMFRAPDTGEGAYLTEMLRANLDVPLYTVPGNHDTGKDHNLKNYRRFFGNPSYFFSYGDTLFVMLDDDYGVSSLPGSNAKIAGCGINATDLAWLESVLSRYRKDFRRCALVMHIPPATPAVLQYYTAEVVVARQLEPLVKRYPVDAIICGHLHISAQSEVYGIPVYHVPSCGQVIRDTIHPDYGYLTLHFTETGAIKATTSYIPNLKRGRNHLLNNLMAEIPGNRRYYYGALFLLIAGFGLLATARRLS